MAAVVSLAAVLSVPAPVLAASLAEPGSGAPAGTGAPAAATAPPRAAVSRDLAAPAANPGDEDALAGHGGAASSTGLEASASAEFATGPAVAEPVTDEERALAEWAFGRFSQARLGLPPETLVSFHRSTSPCESNRGLYRTEDGVARVRVCVVHAKPDVEVAQREHVLLHELAHAWTVAELDPATREAFMQLRGAPSWADVEDEWFERGAEQAAEIITWAVFDRSPGFLNILDKSCAQLTTAFGVLTGGGAPITPEAEACAPAEPVRGVV